MPPTESERDAIQVAGVVVVVAAARRIDVPEVRGVAGVRRTAEPRATDRIYRMSPANNMIVMKYVMLSIDFYIALCLSA